MNNFPSDPLSTTPTRRGDSRRAAHYADEFHVYQKPRMNGTGSTKRASCNHCNGDWAYNETRLKHHIIDPFRGCRKIPQAVRDRIRNADQRVSPVVHSTHAVLPPAKRKRETMPCPGGATTPNPAAAAALTAAQSAVAAVNQTADLEQQHAMPVPAMHQPETGEARSSVQLRVSVEFSVSSGGLLRATWIVAELIQEFHRDVVVVSLVPSADEDTFNIWIGGKVVWSRAPGHPLPDFDHLRPLVRAHVVC